MQHSIFHSPCLKNWVLTTAFNFQFVCVQQWFASCNIQYAGRKIHAPILKSLSTINGKLNVTFNNRLNYLQTIIWHKDIEIWMFQWIIKSLPDINWKWNVTFKNPLFATDKLRIKRCFNYQSFKMKSLKNWFNFQKQWFASCSIQFFVILMCEASMFHLNFIASCRRFEWLVLIFNMRKCAQEVGRSWSRGLIGFRKS